MKALMNARALLAMLVATALRCADLRLYNAGKTKSPKGHRRRQEAELGKVAGTRAGSHGRLGQVRSKTLFARDQIARRDRRLIAWLSAS